MPHSRPFHAHFYLSFLPCPRIHPSPTTFLHANLPTLHPILKCKLSPPPSARLLGPGRHSTTVDGFEMHMGTNYLGAFLLTLLLLPSLQQSSQVGGPPPRFCGFITGVIVE